MNDIQLAVDTGEAVKLTISGDINASLGFGGEIYSQAPYTGAVSVTPSNETQTLNTSGFYLKENITVNPIPSNYGLITWDGSTITVS